jgi:hypothetical protein
MPDGRGISSVTDSVVVNPASTHTLAQRHHSESQKSRSRKENALHTRKGQVLLLADIISQLTEKVTVHSCV